MPPNNRNACAAGRVPAAEMLWDALGWLPWVGRAAPEPEVTQGYKEMSCRSDRKHGAVFYWLHRGPALQALLNEPVVWPWAGDVGASWWKSPHFTTSCPG